MQFSVFAMAVSRMAVTPRALQLSPGVLPQAKRPACGPAGGSRAAAGAGGVAFLAAASGGAVGMRAWRPRHSTLRRLQLQRRGTFFSRVQRRAVVTVARPDELKGAKTDDHYNVPASVVDKLGADLLLRKKHPIGVLWQAMQEYFKASNPEMVFYDREDPIVNTVDNFDKLRLPPGHPGRSPSDTYYVNKDTVLRTHTSAHQCKHMAEFPEVTSFLCAGDVYRRDEIDASHYPVFHQCE
ncbi:unnamed protein product, partial [Prorocentrum cordatum]